MNHILLPGRKTSNNVEVETSLVITSTATMITPKKAHWNNNFTKPLLVAFIPNHPEIKTKVFTATTHILSSSKRKIADKGETVWMVSGVGKPTRLKCRIRTIIIATILSNSTPLFLSTLSILSTQRAFP